MGYWGSMRRPRRLDDSDYRALADWRYALRRFLRSSAEITRKGGVSATQYQLLLFIRGSVEGALSIAEIAERLQVRHHSAVGLVDRCERAGLVRRQRDPGNRRRVLVRTTPRGASLLRRLASAHFAAMEGLGKAFVPPIPGPPSRPEPETRPRRQAAGSGREGAPGRRGAAPG
jgi:DNA-binding MarR family transcriptional regulator